MAETTSMQRLTLRLIDGKPDGMLEVEDFNWTGRVLQISRNDIITKKLHGRDEASHMGVYILFGDKESKPTAYVGKTTEIIQRLSQQVKDKGWWEKAILVTEKNNSLNEAHIGYLEARLYEIVKKIGRVDLENEQKMSKKLSRDDKLDMDRFLDPLLIILPILRTDVFYERPSRQEDKKKMVTVNSTNPANPVFVLKGKQYDASMRLEGSDYIVLKDSYAHGKWQGSDFGNDAEKIKELKNRGILESDGDKGMRFTRDYAFESASKAAKVIVGRNVNGRAVWHVKGSRQALKEWEAEQLNGEEVTKEDMVSNNDIPENQKEDSISSEKIKNTPFTFSMVDIPIGSELKFRKDEKIIAKVAGRDNEIEYKGRVGAISTITQDILNNELGMNRPSAQGAGHWLFEEEVLTKRRKRFESAKQSKANPVGVDKSIDKNIDVVRGQSKTRIEDLPNLTHTGINKAVINGEEIKEPSWRSVLYHIIDKEGEKDKTIQFEAIEGVKIKRGNVRGGGYSYREKAGVSIPSLDSNQCAETIIKITEYFNRESVNYEGVINYEWHNNPKAARPGKEGSIII